MLIEVQKKINQAGYPFHNRLKSLSAIIFGVGQEDSEFKAFKAFNHIIPFSSMQARQEGAKSKGLHQNWRLP
jgi:hypothetical protein